jgi:hypothetical protein
MHLQRFLQEVLSLLKKYIYPHPRPFKKQGGPFSVSALIVCLKIRLRLEFLMGVVFGWVG